MRDMATREDVLWVLSSLRDPDLGRFVVSLGMIKDHRHLRVITVR
ncbi:MAG: hypothetical protein ACHQ0J_13935 [Candidatus Dormibacterales bacterium]